jgi:hypothetical protein
MVGHPSSTFSKIVCQHNYRMRLLMEGPIYFLIEYIKLIQSYAATAPPGQENLR